MGHPIHKHMSSGQRYDDKQAYNKDLSDSARLHYLENEEHDKGMSRESAKEERKNLDTINPVDNRAGMSRHSNHGNSPANGIGDTLKKIGRTGTRMLGDIGMQAVDMLNPDPGSHASGRRPPGATSYAEKDYRKDQEMAHYQKSRDLTAQGKTYFNLSSAFDDDGQGSHMFNSGTPKQTSKYGGKGMKRQAYGGNKGDERRSAKKDY